MARMICKINMGTLMQKVFIQGQKYSNKKTIEPYRISLDDLPDFIVEHSDVQDVFLKGPMEYTKKIKQETEEKEMLKYSKVTKTFHII